MPDARHPKSRRLLYILALALNLAAWFVILRAVILPLVNN